MSRMRQVPVMDVTQKEKAMNRNLPNASVRPAAQSFRPRARKAAAARLRLSDTPGLLSSGCSSLREFCNGVQNITVDLNNLIGSVESILPLLNVYIAALQTRTAPLEPSAAEAPIEVTAAERQEPQAASAPQTVQQPNRPAAPAAPVQSAVQPQTPPMPRPEDLQQLLENPLVKNLMANFMKNTVK